MSGSSVVKGDHIASVAEGTRPATAIDGSRKLSAEATEVVPALGVSPALEVFRSIPTYPEVAPFEHGVWMRLGELVSQHHPVLAELSWFSVHCWRGGDQVRLSRVGQFLIVLFADPDSEAMLVGIPGLPLMPEDRDRLKALRRDRSIRYLSSRTSSMLENAFGPGVCQLTQDRSDADYVYAMSDLAQYEGAGYRAKRKDARRFQTRMGPSVREGRLRDPWALNHLKHTYERWLGSKYGDANLAPSAVRRERVGVDGWPRDERANDIRVFCLEVGGEPVGVSVIEPMWQETWMGLFMKTDPGMPGATAYLRRHVARAGLAEMGDGGLLNIQQDEGLPGLRKAKESYRPIRLEAKFSLDFADESQSDGGTSC